MSVPRPRAVAGAAVTLCLCLTLAGAGPAAAGSITAISKADPSLISSTAGGLSAGSSGSTASSDGRFVVFISQAANLVPGQTEGNDDQDIFSGADVFLYDRVAGTTTLVSRSAASPTTTGNGYSGNPSLSADGNFVLFRSYATDLVAGQVDTAGTNDLFLFDRAAGTVALVSHTAGSAVTAGNQATSDGVISADGAYVLFTTYASNVAAGVTDTNATGDVFLYERATGTVTLVSHASASLTTAANAASSYLGGLSADGSYALFASQATNLATGATDTNAGLDVFLYARATGAVTLVSHASSGATTAANAQSFGGMSLSSDAAYAAFTSNATNLVTGQVDSNGTSDLFLWSRATGAVSLISRSSSSAVTTGNGAASAPRLSADGAYVAYRSQGTNHVASQSDSNGTFDCFLWNRATAATVLVSRTSASAVAASGCQEEELSLSLNGGFVVFSSRGTALVSGQSDTNGVADVFVYNRTAATLALASRIPAAATAAGNAAATTPVISADGAYVSFTSAGSNHLGGGLVDGNGTTDVFLFARAAGALSGISLRDPARPSATAGGASYFDTLPTTSASADGRYVAFTSLATNLVPGQIDTNGRKDVFLHDRATGSTVLVSRAKLTTATTANNASSGPVISADGRYVAFVSDANNLITGNDWNIYQDVYLFDRVTATLKLVSRAASSATTVGNGYSGGIVSISADGAYIAFSSGASDLLPSGADTNGADDAFLFDRAAGTVSLISRTTAGATSVGNRASGSPILSDDGQFIAFASRAGNLVAGQVDAVNDWDIFLFDRVAGTTVLVSHQPGAATTAVNGFCSKPNVTADGGFVTFSSNAVNLVPGQVDTAGTADIFLFERATGAVTLLTHAGGAPATTANAATNGAGAISADGAWITFASPATDLVSGQTDTNGAGDVFLFQRATGTLSLISHASGNPVQAGNAGCFSDPMLSRDGTTVAFACAATDLLAGLTDTAGTYDYFLYHRPTGAATLVSHSLASSTVAASRAGNRILVSDNGRIALFSNTSTTLVAGDWNGSTDLFAHTPEADLRIEKSDGAETVAPDDPLTYTITVENLGPDPVSGATVTDAFPVFFTGAAWTCAAAAGASCPASGSGDSLSEPVDLPPGGSVTYTVTGTVALDATVVLSNTAEVALPADVTDPNPEDNSSSDIDGIDDIDP